MRVIIAGSRTITNPRILRRVLSSKLEKCSITEVVCGGARGADELGKRWAIENGVPVKMFPADWNRHGKSAGYICNAEMVDYAEALIALWDGKSRGTKHTIDIARKKGLLIIVEEI